MALRGASGDQCAVPVTMSSSTLPYWAQSSEGEPGHVAPVRHVTRARVKLWPRDWELELERTGEFPEIGDPEYLEMFSKDVLAKLKWRTKVTQGVEN